MTDKIKSSLNEDIDNEGYREALVAHSPDLKACVYDKNDKSYCFLGLQKASIGFKKTEEPIDES